MVNLASSALTPLKQIAGTSATKQVQRRNNIVLPNIQQDNSSIVPYLNRKYLSDFVNDGENTDAHLVKRAPHVCLSRASTMLYRLRYPTRLWCKDRRPLHHCVFLTAAWAFGLICYICSYTICSVVIDRQGRHRVVLVKFKGRCPVRYSGISRTQPCNDIEWLNQHGESTRACLEIFRYAFSHLKRRKRHTRHKYLICAQLHAMHNSTQCPSSLLRASTQP